MTNETRPRLDTFFRCGRPAWPSCCPASLPQFGCADSGSPIRFGRMGALNNFTKTARFVWRSGKRTGLTIPTALDEHTSRLRHPSQLFRLDSATKGVLA